MKHNGLQLEKSVSKIGFMLQDLKTTHGLYQVSEIVARFDFFRNLLSVWEKLVMMQAH